MNRSFILGCLGVLVTAAPATAEDGDWRGEMPALGPTPEINMPTYEREVLDNGLTVLVATLRDLPILSLRLVTRGGAAMDPGGQAGLSSLVYGMLEEGAGERSALEFSDALADLGAGFSSGSARDHGQVALTGLSRVGDDVAAILADAVRRPRLAEEDFERLRGETLAGLEARLGSPHGLAFMVVPGLVYGPEHPYGHPPSGDAKSLAGLSIADVKAHHERLLVPGRSAFVAVGDIDLEGAVALAKKHFGDWPELREDPLDIPAVEATERRQIAMVDKAKSPQTMAVIARPLFARGHPDEEALELANGVFGGSFASRLNMTLREDKGYTYGASSNVSFRRGVGVFTAASALQADHGADGIWEMLAELTRISESPPTAEELDRVKKGRIRGLPGDFERVSDLAGVAGQLFVYELPLDWYDHVAERITAVSLERVQAVAKKYLDPEVMTVLLVGDVASTKPKLEERDLGPIEVVAP